MERDSERMIAESRHGLRRVNGSEKECCTRQPPNLNLLCFTSARLDFIYGERRIHTRDPADRGSVTILRTRERMSREV
eukprot:1153469-Pelagomonas_calceolata.AAC.3